MPEIINLNKNFKKKATVQQKRFLILNFIGINIMNIYLFWILFLALWGIVPLMIIKGRVDEAPKLKIAPVVKTKKKGWFN